MSHDAAVILRGYLDGYHPPVDPSVLVDAAEWLDDPGCWPLLLSTVGGAPTAVDAFDADRGDLDVMLTEMTRPDRWPVFSVDLGRGNRVHLVWRNFEGDAGWDYLLSPAGTENVITLAALEGHFRGPGLSWPELVAATRNPRLNRSPAERFLLLLPAMSDADMPAEALRVVTGAVAAVGGQRHQEDVARELLTADSRWWGTASWAESGGVPVSLARHATRGVEMPLAERRLIAAALSGS